MSATERIGSRRERDAASAAAPPRWESAARRARALAGSSWALVGGAVAAAALSLLFPSTATYDPWAWIIWGREITELDLETTTGPSWKPLPVLFTTLFAPLGDAAPALWLVVARAGGLLALAMAYRVASRLAGDRIYGVLAGTAAAGGLLLTTGWVRHSGLGNSEGLLVALVLWAIDRHLAGARRQAFALGFAAALLRPEVWPFLGLYAVFLWRADRAARALVVALLAAIPLLWFGPELAGSGDPFRASARAQRDLSAASPGRADEPAREVVRVAGELLPAPVAVGALVALVLAALAFARRRGDAGTVLVCLAAGVWIALVAAMAEAGYSGNPRYLVVAAALACVAAGLGLARVVQGAGSVAARLGAGSTATRVATLAAAVALVAAASLSAAGRAAALGDQVGELRREAARNADIDEAIRLAGGRERVLACGRIFTGPYQVPVLAWELHVHFGQVDYQPEAPGTIFRARPRGAPPPAVDTPFTLAGRTAEWDVFRACAAGS